MRRESEVATFLNDFKEKMKFWDVLFRDDRGKNTQALVDLEIRPGYVGVWQNNKEKGSIH